MARGTAKAGKTDRRDRKRSRPTLSLTKALGLIILIEGIALGLKADSDRQRILGAKQVETHREALAVSERVSGKVATVKQTLSLSYQAGWSTTETARSFEDIELVASMADALTAPADSRLRAAGNMASELLATDQHVGMTEGGDLVIAHDPEAGAARLAIVPSSTWLPELLGSRTVAMQTGRLDGGQIRSAQQILGCSPIAQSNVSVCVQSQVPWMTRAVITDLIIYALLLLGPALAILGLFRLFEQRRAESEAFEGEATRAGRILKTVLKQSKAGFWSWDEPTGFFKLSEEAAALLGTRTQSELSKEDFLDLVHDEHVAAMDQSLDTLEERGFLQQVFANRDKSAWFDMRAEPDAEGGVLNGVLRDVTETKVAIARSRQAENRLRSALEGFSGPFALWDRRKRLIYWNRAFTHVFGLEPTIRNGMGYDTVMLSQAANVLERRPSDQDNNEAEIIKIRDGHWFKIVERITPAGGMITMGLDVSSDVKNEVELTRQQAKLRKLVAELERSEMKAADLTRNLKREKQNAERSANSKSAFLANMSHELRTPLNAINGFSEILVDEMFGPLGDARYKDYARDILESGRHLLDMITDILDMAKIEAGKMTVDLQPIDLTDPVDAAVRMIRRRAEEKNVNLTLAANSGLPLVEADHRAIRQMILNLVSNAIKFTDEGGEIRVTVDQKGDEVRVAVRDNGIGIPADALPRLGQPFEQVSDARDRNYDGTGLGLALTKSFAEMHGGRLVLASEPGRGTQVSIYLPVPSHLNQAASSVA